MRGLIELSEFSLRSFLAYWGTPAYLWVVFLKIYMFGFQIFCCRVFSGPPIYDSLSSISENIMGIWIFFILNIWIFEGVHGDFWSKWSRLIPILAILIIKNYTKGTVRLEKKTFWYFFDHRWSKRSCFNKIVIKFFSSRKVTFGHFFEKIFCPRWQVENSTLTLKFWALRSKRVKRSFRARITLDIT